MKMLFARLVLLASIFIFVDEAFADTQINQLVKEQQRNDSNVFQEMKGEKKDVFSSLPGKVAGRLIFPVEDNCFPIKELIIENDFLTSRRLENLTQAVEGQCLGIKGIDIVATKIQDYYINSGFITTRVITPSQDLAGRRLVLRVIPGRIGNIIIAENDFNGLILPFATGDVLNLRDIEQGLENIQRTPENNVKINIVPGEREGYSNVVIATNRTSFWNLQAGWNNWGDESTGRQLISSGGYLYNMAKLNDIFLLSGTTSSTRAYNNFSTYYSIPLGYWEYELFYSQSKSRQPVNIADYSLDYVGKNTYFSVKASRTLYRDRDQKIAGSAEVLRRKSSYTLDNIALRLQERDMGNIRLAINYKKNIASGIFDATLRWQRFTTFFGGKYTPDMMTDDVDKKSQIVSLYGHYLQWLTASPMPIYYDLNIGTQYSRHALTLQDQFSIGNRWTVRGFENSSGLEGNKGIYLQNTLGLLTGYKNIELYLGADYGQTDEDNYAQSINPRNKLLGMAIGLKGMMQNLGYEISLTTPLIYPKYLNVDSFAANFNISYQL